MNSETILIEGRQRTSHPLRQIGLQRKVLEPHLATHLTGRRTDHLPVVNLLHELEPCPQTATKGEPGSAGRLREVLPVAVGEGRAGLPRYSNDQVIAISGRFSIKASRHAGAI